MKDAPKEDPATTRLFTWQQPVLVRRLVGGGLWVFIGRVAGIGLTLLSNVILARWLSPAEFGQFLTVVSIIGFLSIVARFGLDRILVRFVAEGLATQNAMLVKRTLRVSFSTGLVSTLCVAVLAIVILGSLRDVLEIPALVLLFVGASIPLFAILFLVAESFRGFHQLPFASLFQPNSGPLTTSVFIGCIIVIFLMPASLFLAVMCYILSVACILPIGVAFLARTVKRNLQTEENTNLDTSTPLSLSRVLSICAPIAISDAFSFLTTIVGFWIVVFCCSQDDVALYGTARLLTVFAALPLNLVNMTVLSSIPELYAQGNLARLQRMLQITATVAAIPTALLVLLFAIAPGPILDAVFGSFYREAAHILIILSVAQVVSTWTGSCRNLLLLTGRHNVVAGLNVMAVVILLSLGPIIARAYGATGIATASACVIVATNLAAWAIAKIQTGVWTHATFRLSG